MSKKQNINIWELPRLLLVFRLEWILGVAFPLFLAAVEMVARLHLVLWLDHKGIFVGKVLSPDVWIQILAATARRSPLSRFTFRRQRGNKSTGLL